ncbi:nuclease [Exophiala xenobiotica]|uniref:Endonuclease n=1 Tax=Lithohypha guttulata TaxID=1690604 RepID=A0ABR0K7R3_9EURO|nr:nuclease [Lithohypha guttulata]KAK5327912.1 nuclease [Exophiala xenobiotica]
MSKSTLALIAAGSAAAVPTSTLPNLPPITGAPAPQPLPTPVSQPVSSNLPLAPVNPSGVLKYGLTPPIPDTNITPSHLSSYNRMTRNPHWVAEHFTPQSLSQNNASRRNSVFYEDTTVPPMFRAKLHDYFRSGYDRGHQTPAADAKWSQDAMDSTFVLSNMCPQVGDGFNRDYWAHFEDFCRNLTKHYPSIRVVTGPLYLPKQHPDGKWRVTYEVIGNPPNVAVPTHFYKVIYGEDHLSNPGCKVALGAFVLPNTEIPNRKSLRDFEVPLEAVERASGLIFADKLPMERRKRLCTEVNCEVLVREFDKAKQQGNALNAGQKPAAQIAQESRRW